MYSSAEKLRKHKQWSAAIDAFAELLDTDYPGTYFAKYFFLILSPFRSTDLFGGAGKAHLLNQRGVCYQELGQHEEALRDLTASLELDPSQPVSKLCKIVILSQFVALSVSLIQKVSLFQATVRTFSATSSDLKKLWQTWTASLRLPQTMLLPKLSWRKCEQRWRYQSAHGTRSRPPELSTTRTSGRFV